jgi:LmbE family N-acetylglucosaminyl deacetylase
MSITTAPPATPAPGIGPVRGLDAQRRVAALGHVMGIWAHPDDETYLSGGLLALATANGQRTTCVTATAGEHGTDDSDAWPPRRLARQRRGELQHALHVLGVDEHHWLGHEDGTCADVDPAAAVARLRSLIDRCRPDTIITFGPDGFTGHPDHQAVGRWASLAAIGDGRVDLLHVAKTADWIERFTSLHERRSIFEPGYPRPVPESRVALDLHLGGRALDHKVTALRVQHTQTAPVIQAFGADQWVAWNRRETFAVPEHDQFLEAASVA